MKSTLDGQPRLGSKRLAVVGWAELVYGADVWPASTSRAKRHLIDCSLGGYILDRVHASLRDLAHPG